MSGNILYQLYLCKAIGYKYIGKNDALKQIKAEISYNMLNEQIRNCNLCELCKSRNKAVLSCRDGQSVVLVENFPSRIDDRNGYAKLNPRLLEYLDIAGIGSKKFYFTYILKCRPFEKKIIKNRHYSRCMSYFEQEIKMLKPKVIVALGEEVFFRLINDTDQAFESMRGGIFKFKETLILPTYSMDWIMKNPSQEDRFINDLKKIKGYI